MPYIIKCNYFIIPAYFYEHEGPGFTVGTDKEKAKVHPTQKLAEIACIDLEKASGMKAEVKRLE